jgi:antitoxin component YwqK of YwqJK toxin-antitoxin module
MTYHNGVLVGQAQDFYESGKVERETAYTNQARDRKVISYFPEGSVREEQQFKNNLPTGVWRTFYPNTKQVQSQQAYIAGKLSGEKLTYYSNGTVQSRLNYENGRPTGLGLDYYASGKLKAATTYVKGIKLGPYRQLREDETIEVSGTFRNNKESGVWTYFGTDGKTIVQKKTFRNGQVVTAGNK